jgi:hypothetical protein
VGLCEFNVEDVTAPQDRPFPMRLSCSSPQLFVSLPNLITNHQPNSKTPEDQASAYISCHHSIEPAQHCLAKTGHNFSLLLFTQK